MTTHVDVNNYVLQNSNLSDFIMVEIIEASEMGK